MAAVSSSSVPFFSSGLGDLRDEDSVYQLVVSDNSSSDAPEEHAFRRRINLKTVPKTDAPALIFPSPDQRQINMCSLMHRFEGTKVGRLEAFGHLSEHFSTRLKFFAHALPAEPNKTISQLAAVFRLKQQDCQDSSRIPEESGKYLLGLPRVEGTPCMPVKIWTQYAEWWFCDNSEPGKEEEDKKKKDERYTKGRRRDILREWLLHRLPAGTSEEDIKPLLDAPPAVSTTPTADAILTEVALAAGGGCDVVTAACWLCEKKAQKGVVVQCGRGEVSQTLDGTSVSTVADFSEDITRSEQYYQGTDLVGRTQFLSKKEQLPFDYLFTAQDKKILAQGDVCAVVHHLESLRDGLIAKLNGHSVSAIHVVDAGGDILQIISPTRQERDVWNLILGMMVARSLCCKLVLAVVSPGLDGQSVWISDKTTEDTVGRADVEV